MKKLNECKVKIRSTKQNGENTANVEETGNASTRQVKKPRTRWQYTEVCKVVYSVCLPVCFRNYIVYSLPCYNILDMTCNFSEQNGKSYRFIVVREMGFEPTNSLEIGS